jgi:hypothetical protein
MTPSSTSFAHGTSITVSGAVTPGTATGAVALMTDSTEPAQQGQTLFTLSSGAYSGTTANLPGGSYNLWAQYGGDSANGMSTSAKVPITVTPEASGIYFNAISPSGATAAGKSITGSLDYGTQLQLSAQVAPSSKLSTFETCTTNCPIFTSPTGTVTFTDSTGGSGLPYTSVLNAEGDAEFNAPFSVGSHSVTASYAGDKSYNAAPATSPITFTVAKDTPVLQLDASAITSSMQGINGPGQPLVFTLQVMNGAQANAASSSIFPVPVAAPTGTVTVTGFPSGVPTSATLSGAVDPAIQGGTQAVEGVANFIIPSGTTSGTYNVSFTYSGDSNYLGVTKGPFQIPVVNTNGDGFQNSTITATLNGTSSTPNSALVVTGTITGTSAGIKAPTGSVFVYASGYFVTTIGVSPGSGITSTFTSALNSQTLPQGANQVTLQYSGDGVYNPSAFTLNNGTPIANPISDFTMVPNTTIVPVAVGSDATATITLASLNGFSGSLALTCTAAGVSCSITPASSNLVSGASTTVTLQIVATSATAGQSYNVLVTGKDSTGQYIHTLAIKTVAGSSQPGAANFAMSSSGAISLSAGATSGNTSTISVTPANGFTGAVALTCAVASPTGANKPATCSISPASVTISGTTPQTAALTVTTSATALNEPLKLFWPSTGGAVLALLFFGIPKRRRNWLAMLGLLVLFISGVAIGCGGGGSSSSSGSGGTGGGGTTPGTTSGAYSVTVTGTSGSVTQNTVVTVNVQ